MTSREPELNCTKCGKCCKGFDKERGVILFPADVARLAKRLQLLPADFVSRYCRRELELENNETGVKLHLLKDNRGDCVFLNDDNLCSVYDIRPVQCERAPFRFFWQGLANFPYDCVKGVSVPAAWSSDADDRQLLDEVFGRQTEHRRHPR
ncbi:MAG TPA: YkgJ family cysteine cluster protein [Xanthobacteraceae bacterium]|nr:YkgJ family cysteine cluster protein [Xanthobacteraceae bacterium]